MNSNDIINGLRVTTMLPLDAKGYFLNEDALKNLGVNNNLAFTYFDGMIAYSILEGKTYRWREPKQSETGLLLAHFQYPAGIVVGGINYSNKSYNFFEIKFGQNPIPYLTLELKAKGEGNTLKTLQAGDIVEGFKDATTYWDAAIYMGGGISNRANYVPLVETLLGNNQGTFVDETGAPINGTTVYPFDFKGGFVSTEGYLPNSIVRENGNLYINIQEVPVNSGLTAPSLQPTFWSLFLTKGTDGLSAYQIALANGFQGTQAAWVLSLDGTNGLSAYQIAIANGFQGTQAAWVLSLVGTAGLSAYEVALVNGFLGTQATWLASLKGDAGSNASNNLQRDASVSFTLADTDNNFVIQLFNVADIVITVPDTGLRGKFNCGFRRMGAGEVSFAEAVGVTVTNPTGKRIARVGDPVYIERNANTQNYPLMGNTKI